VAAVTSARPDRVSKFLVPEIVFGRGALSEAGWPLPHVTRFNAATKPDRYIPIAQALGVPKGPADLGVTLADIPNRSTNTLDDSCPTTNPRDPSVDEVSDIFRAAR